MWGRTFVTWQPTDFFWKFVIHGARKLLLSDVLRYMTNMFHSFSSYNQLKAFVFLLQERYLDAWSILLLISLIGKRYLMRLSLKFFLTSVHLVVF